MKADQTPENSYDEDVDKLISQKLSDADFLKHKRKMEYKYYGMSTLKNIPFDSLRFKFGIPVTDETMERIINVTSCLDSPAATAYN